MIASEGTPEHQPAEVAYLPLDGGSPANPTNPYASSKAAGEILVRTLFAGAGRESQSLRFPWLTDAVLAPATCPKGSPSLGTVSGF